MSTKVVVIFGRTPKYEYVCANATEADEKKRSVEDAFINDPWVSVRIESVKATEDVVAIKHNDPYEDLHTVALGACGHRVSRMSRYGR